MHHPAPTGDLALIFTDVEGSTALWEHVPEAMSEGLRLHDACMRELLEVHRGYEVKTEGDAFMVAFQDPADAVGWCLAVQEALPELAWPAALLEDPWAREIRGEDGELLHRGLRVRMGGHRGAPDCRPDPVTGRMDYFGPVVNRAARVGGAGHGGQLVLSATLWEAGAPGVDPARVRCEDLGAHGLKGLREPEGLVQVLPASLAGRRFPPVRTESPKRTNLLAAPDATLGRGADLAELRVLLGGPDRLVTVLAPGGSGKTRLVRELGLELAECESGNAGGVWFCDLTQARSREDLLLVVAEVLGVSLAKGHDLAAAVETISEALSGRGSILMIFDNFEQLVAHAAGTVGRWLAGSPGLRCLVTSREPLGLRDERRYGLDPLTVEAGLELFEDRARQVRPGFRVQDGNREPLRRLVERLDGLPLALELAAAGAHALGGGSPR